MATAAAKRYGRAVFEVARDEGQVEEWRGRLVKVRDLLANPEVSAVLTNPTIPLNARMELISAAPHELDSQATNLARLLIESNRVTEIGGVVEVFDALADESAGRVSAMVTTAVELTDAERERVTRQLSERLGKEVTMQVTVDRRILGGLKLQYGDRLIDASVATKLQQLRRRLADAT